MNIRIIVIVCLTLLIGCGQFKEKDLMGKWQATFISEGGVQLEMDYSPVQLEFTEDGFYTFNSTIDYKEAGTYYINGSYLFTVDTVNTASTEKAVEILTLSQDSLTLKMIANGKDKLMKFTKKAN